MSFMTMLSRKFELPAPHEALPGRADRVAPKSLHAVLGCALDEAVPQNMSAVLLGMGSFWAAEPLFWQLPGVLVTSAGFAGGYTPNPTYNEVGTGRTGHAEVVRVVFDPLQIQLEALLKVFWEGHNPTLGMRQGNDVGTQFRSVIFVESKADLETAQKSKEAYQAALKQASVLSTVTTEVALRTDFFFADDYHQQYSVKNSGSGKSLKGLGVELV